MGIKTISVYLALGLLAACAEKKSAGEKKSDVAAPANQAGAAAITGSDDTPINSAELCSKNQGNWDDATSRCLSAMMTLTAEDQCKAKNLTWDDAKKQCFASLTVQTAQDQCAAAKGSWDDAKNWCTLPIALQAAVDACKAKGAIWSFVNGLCLETKEDQCKAAGGVLDPTLGCAIAGFGAKKWSEPTKFLDTPNSFALAKGASGIATVWAASVTMGHQKFMGSFTDASGAFSTPQAIVSDAENPSSSNLAWSGHRGAILIQEDHVNATPTVPQYVRTLVRFEDRVTSSIDMGGSPNGWHSLASTIDSQGNIAISGVDYNSSNLVLQNVQGQTASVPVTVNGFILIWLMFGSHTIIQPVGNGKFQILFSAYPDDPALTGSPNFDPNLECKIYSVIYDIASNAVSAPEVVPGTKGVYDRFLLYTLANGERWLIFASDPAGLQSARYDGQTWVQQTIPTPGITNFWDWKFFVLGDEQINVVWLGSPPFPDPFAQPPNPTLGMSTLVGGTWQAPVEIATNVSANSFDITRNALGQAVLAWQEYMPASGLWTRRFEGGTWSAPELIGNNLILNSLTADPSGAFLLFVNKTSASGAGFGGGSSTLNSLWLK